MAIERIPALYSRQELIEGLHPPERVLIYVTSGVTHDDNKLLEELVEGLILIGTIEITVLDEPRLLNSVASQTIHSYWDTIQATIRRCRPYVKFSIVNVNYAIENAESLDVDDIIIVRRGECSEKDLEFADQIEDAYVANADTFEVMRLKKPSVQLSIAPGQAPNVENIRELAVSMQALLLVNMMSKPAIYKKTGICVSAVKFMDRVATNVAMSLGVAGFTRNRVARGESPAVLSTVKSRPRGTDDEIAARCAREGVATLTDLSRKYGINPATMRTRLKNGWSLDRALATHV